MLSLVLTLTLGQSRCLLATPVADGGVSAIIYGKCASGVTWDAPLYFDGGAVGVISGGSGTVTDVSVVTANGVSGSVATSTTTPAITLTLGAITPASVASAGAVSGTNLSGTNTGDQTKTCGFTTYLRTLAAGTGSTCAQPDVSELTGVMTTAQGGTGLGSPPAASRALVSVTAGTAWGALPSCSGATNALTWSTGTEAFGCNTISGGGTYSGIGACGANTWASTLNDNAAPTCTQPAFSNLSGSASIAQGGTTETASTEDAVLVGAGTTDWAPKVLPSCSTGSSALTYNTTTNAFGCNSISGGAGNTGTFAVDFGSGALSRYDSDVATITAAWVSAGSSITLTPKCVAAVGGNTVDNCLMSKLQCSVVAISAGVSFDVQCLSPITASGGYTVSYSGA